MGEVAAGEWRRRVEKLGVNEEDRISLDGLAAEGRRGLEGFRSLGEEVAVAAAAEIEAMAEKDKSEDWDLKEIGEEVRRGGVNSIISLAAKK